MYTYLHLSLCGMMGGRNAGVDPVYSPHFFLFFSCPSLSLKGHIRLQYLQFFSKCFSATEFPHFVVFCFCFAVCHKEWPFEHVTTEIRFFALKYKKEKVLDRDQNGFLM